MKEGETNRSDLVLPSPQQLEWAACEIGVIIHHDVQVYEPGYRFRDDREYVPSAERFNPAALDTDQWIETAVALGAKYAILVAKHCSGFSLWPTKAHPYSVAASPWRDGKGDVVADFIASCKKYNVRPGLYASCGCNAYLKVDHNALVGDDDAERWLAYVETVKTQLRELWSNYGPLFEVWFDGGNLPVDRGGREISELLMELQPQAITFQGDPENGNSVRWIGNERAEAPDPCRATCNLGTQSDGTQEGDFQERYHGSVTGKYWCPGEADMPNRDQVHAWQGGWFWQPGEDDLIYPPLELLDRYYTSVGRNCNFLLGMVIDDRGRVPESDVRQMTELGDLIRKLTSCCRGETSGVGVTFDIAVDDSAPVDMICLMEDIAQGERVLYFTVSGFDGNHYHTLATGKAIGYKRLVRIHPARFPSYRLQIAGHKEGAEPVMQIFSLWDTAHASK